MIILTSNLIMSSRRYFSYIQFSFFQQFFSSFHQLYTKVTYFSKSTLIVIKVRAGNETIIEEIGKTVPWTDRLFGNERALALTEKKQSEKAKDRLVKIRSMWALDGRLAFEHYLTQLKKN